MNALKNQTVLVRVTCDTNIFISALNFPGNPRRILNMAESGTIHLSVSNAILHELTRVLRGKKFAWPEAEIERAIRQISRFAEHVEPAHTLSTIKNDPSDNRILECAVAGQSDFLVTGDEKHLLKLGHHGPIKIVNPADFLKVPEISFLDR